MKTTFRPRPLALALAGLASIAMPGVRTAAAADLKLEMSLGVASAHLDHPAAQFGQYHGITRNKDAVFGNLKLSYKPGSDYAEATGNNLGMDNQGVTLSAGRYGSYGLVLEQDKFASPIAVDAQTPLDGAGSDRLTLPSGFQRGATTGAMTNLATSLRSTDLGLDRTTERAGLFFTPTDRWRFEIGAEQHAVHGKKPLGGMMRFSVSTILPAPVDEKTSILSAALNYRGDGTQWSAGYKLSKYDNHFDSLTFDNPFNGGLLTAAQQGRISLAPDNLQHTASLTGAVNNLPLASRLTLNIERSRMEQDESFLPYSYRAALVDQAQLPRGSANIQVDTTHVNLNLSSRPLANLTTNLRYRFHERDSDIPRALFQRVVNDAASSSGPPVVNQVVSSNALAHESFPTHSLSHQLKFEGSYSLGLAGTVKAGVRRDIEERSDRAVAKSTEDAIFGGFSRRLGERAGLDIRLEHAKRKAEGGYDQLRVFELVHSPQYLGTNPAMRFDNHPLARQYDIADRSRDKLGMSYTLHATENLNFGLHAQYLRDAYPDGEFGLKFFTSQNYTLDADYVLAEDYSVYTFATEEMSDYAIRGRQYASLTESNDATRNWTMENNDRIFTLGLGGTKRVLDDKLRLKLGYSRSVSDNAIHFTAGSALPIPVALPAGKQTRDRVELRGDYEFMPRTTIGLGAIHDRYQVRDWARDGIAAGSSAVSEVLTLVSPTSGYRAYTLYGQLGYRW